ncbi:MAG: aldo/keto reductase [Planctomycetota bacterium]|nr:aldo/keto reductase [Planctomycetota bacterium]
MPKAFSEKRYESMSYRRCGKSGLKLPALSLGLWHNFGGVDSAAAAKAMLRRAFDLGITHFDLANNYGPPPGSAELTFGRALKSDFKNHRDELIVSTKAGFRMGPGPYGDWGSRKYLLSSLDQSLKRMKLEYVDIFYHHRPDPETPLEETLGALEQAVRSGKALYAGVSNYDGPRTAQAAPLLKGLGVPLTIHQPSYSLFNRWIEKDLLDVAGREDVGLIAFCPLAQGLLTDRYLKGVPKGSRASKKHGFLKKDRITPEVVAKIERLDAFAKARGQSLARLALQWVLRDPRVTSALIGASKVSQLEENVKILTDAPLKEDELKKIDSLLG